MAFECALRQGRASEMSQTLYESQSRFGVQSWQQLAALAQVADSVRFGECMRDSHGKAKVAAGKEFARALSVSTTPTVIVNGWLFDPAFPSAIEKAIERAIEGKSPKP